MSAMDSCKAGPYSLSRGATPLKLHQRHLGEWRLGPTPLTNRRLAPTPLLRLELVAEQTPGDAFRQKMQFSGLPGPENVKNNEK